MLTIVEYDEIACYWLKSFRSNLKENKWIHIIKVHNSDEG